MDQDNDKTVVGKLETMKHIRSVRSWVCRMIEKLDDRARNHDQSKLESPEKEIFGEHGKALAKIAYGTEKYNELLEKVKVAIDHHYSKNRHHPEHWPVPESEYDKVIAHVATLKEDDPSKAWLTEYASSLKSQLNNMTLLDMIEMLCDWKAATERNKNGNIRTSIEFNATKYGMSEQLKKIFENSIREDFQE
jgi:hypothetical protein